MSRELSEAWCLGGWEVGLQTKVRSRSLCAPPLSWYTVTVRNLSFSGRSCDVYLILVANLIPEKRESHLKNSVCQVGMCAFFCLLRRSYFTTNDAISGRVNLGRISLVEHEPGTYAAGSNPPWSLRCFWWRRLSQQQERKLGLKTIWEFLKQTAAWEEIRLECWGLSNSK